MRTIHKRFVLAGLFIVALVACVLNASVYATNIGNKNAHAKQTVTNLINGTVPKGRDYSSTAAGDGGYIDDRAPGESYETSGMYKGYSASEHNYVDVLGNGRVFRGGNSRSGVSGVGSGYLDHDVNDFTTVLPYGTTYINTSLLTSSNWQVDIPEDSPFAIVANGQSPIIDAQGTRDTTSPYTYASVNNGTEPQICYIGGTTSFIAGVGGFDENGFLGTAPDANGDGRPDDGDQKLALLANGGEGSASFAASQADPVSFGSSNITIEVRDGTNYIVSPDGSYLYKITYPDAAVLNDGSTANLVLTITELRVESATDITPGSIIKLQGPNNFTSGIQAKLKRGSEEKFVIRNFVMGDSATDTRDTQSGRYKLPNAVGNSITWTLQVVDDDGTTHEGAISYACRDLDLPSLQSFWGRQWGYDYAEGEEVIRGAQSYAVLPTYDAVYLSQTTRDNGWIWQDLGPDNGKVPTQNGAGPLYVEQTDASAQAGTANGVRFFTQAATNRRKLDGSYIVNPLVSAASIMGKDIKEHYAGGLYDSIWVYNRNDNGEASKPVYDSGMALMLSSEGSTLRWTGSGGRLAHSVCNTMIFDSSVYAALEQSHGTGGGIYVETYDAHYDGEGGTASGYDIHLSEGNVVTGVGANVTSTVVPEDGYRVECLWIEGTQYKVKDDGLYNADGSNQVGAWTGVGDEQKITLAAADHEQNDVIVSKNSDGTYDVSFYKLSTMTGGESYRVHADFTADFYFSKTWEGVTSEDDLPELTFTATPYEFLHTFELDHDGDGTQTEFTLKNTTITGGGESWTLQKNTWEVARVDGSIVHYNVTLKEVTDASGVVATLDKRFIKDGSPITFTVDKNSPLIYKKESTGSSITWKMKYPAAGLVSGAYSYPKMPIEISTHNPNNNHIERLFWFATEADMSNWALERYDNTHAEAPGKVSYVSLPDGETGQNTQDTNWYEDATADYDATRQEIVNVGAIHMFLSPFNSDSSSLGDGGETINKGYREIRATKVWDDNDNANNNRTDVWFHIDAHVSHDGTTDTFYDVLPPQRIAADAAGDDLSVVWGNKASFDYMHGTRVIHIVPDAGSIPAVDAHGNPITYERLDDDYGYKQRDAEVYYYINVLYGTDDDGDPVTFAVRETASNVYKDAVDDPVPAYTTDIQGPVAPTGASNEWTVAVTNSQIANKSIRVQKLWDDPADSSLRSEARLSLWNKLGEDGTWEDLADKSATVATSAEAGTVFDVVTWDGLPAFRDGKQVFYKVVEDTSGEGGLHDSGYSTTYTDVTDATSPVGIDQDTGVALVDSDGSAVDRSVLVTNTYVKPATLTGINVEKQLDGRSWVGSDAFDVALIVSDDSTPMPEDASSLDDIRYAQVELTNTDTPVLGHEGRYRDASGFGPITYDADDMDTNDDGSIKETTFVYHLRELTPAEADRGYAPGMTYSTKRYEMRVVVGLVDGALQVQSVGYYDGDVALGDGILPLFTNTYSAHDVTYHFVADKAYTSYGNTTHLEDGAYDFVLKPVGANAGIAPMPANTTGAGAARTYTVQNQGVAIQFETHTSDGIHLNYDQLTTSVAEGGAGFTHDELVAGVGFTYEMYESIPEGATNNNDGSWSEVVTRGGTRYLESYDGIHHVRTLTVRLSGTGTTSEVLEVNVGQSRDFYYNAAGEEVDYDETGHEHHSSGGSPIFHNLVMPLTSVAGTKTWVDNAFEHGPVVVALQSKTASADWAFVPEATATASETTGWAYGFDDVPAYSTDHEALTYRVVEQDVPSSYVARGGEATDGYDLTNTRVTSVSATKVWDDSSSPEQAAHTNLTMRLLADGMPARTIDGALVANKTIPAGATGDALTCTWDDVPLHREDGSMIAYTVQEDGAEARYTTSQEISDSGTSVTVTNTLNAPPVGTDATSVNRKGVVQGGHPQFSEGTARFPYSGAYAFVAGESTSTVEPQDARATIAGSSVKVGTYTINPDDATVTFTPVKVTAGDIVDDYYIGVVDPIRVRVTDLAGMIAEATYTPTVTGLNTVTQAITRTISYQYFNESGNVAHAPVQQTLTLSRTETVVDPVTGWISWSDWAIASGSFESVASPTMTTSAEDFAMLEGWTPDKASVDAVSADELLDYVNNVYKPQTDDAWSHVEQHFSAQVYYHPAEPATDEGQTLRGLYDAAGAIQSHTWTPSLSPTAAVVPDGLGTANDTLRYSLLDEYGNETDELDYDEGSYVIDAMTGTVTFTPADGFTGTAPQVEVVLIDKVGEYTSLHPTASYTPTVVDNRQEATAQQTIRYTYLKVDGEPAAEPYTRSGALHRFGTVDEDPASASYGEVSYDASLWLPEHAVLEAVVSPSIDEYTPSKETVEAMGINPNTDSYSVDDVASLVFEYPDIHVVYTPKSSHMETYESIDVKYKPVDNNVMVLMLHRQQCAQMLDLSDKLGTSTLPDGTQNEIKDYYFKDPVTGEPCTNLETSQGTYEIATASGLSPQASVSNQYLFFTPGESFLGTADPITIYSDDTLSDHIDEAISHYESKLADMDPADADYDETKAILDAYLGYVSPWAQYTPTVLNNRQEANPTLTVYYTYNTQDGAQAYKPYQQTLKAVRIADFKPTSSDSDAQGLVWGTWYFPYSNQFSSVESPEIEGWVPDRLEVSSIVVGDPTQNYVEHVVYQSTKTYWVTYVDPDGTIYMGKTYQAVGSPEPASPANPTKDGQVFVRWDRAVDADGNVTYTAVWKPLQSSSATTATSTSSNTSAGTGTQAGSSSTTSLPQTSDDTPYVPAIICAIAGMLSLVCAARLRSKV